MIGARLAAIGVHVFTASGAALGLLALERAAAKDFASMFGWLALALFVDGIDGTLARMADVRRKAPWFDGDVLDLVVDFLTYVVVPAAAIWQAALMPPVLAAVSLLIMVTASALYFADRRMKTAEHWFRGFPAIWNVVLVYFFAFPMPGWLAFAAILLLSALLFAPVKFVHPMRVAPLRVPTAAVCVVWFVCAALLVASGFAPHGLARAGLIAAGIYILLLPLMAGRGSGSAAQ